MKEWMKKLTAVLLSAVFVLALLPAMGVKAAPENQGCEKWYEITDFEDLSYFLALTEKECEAQNKGKRVGFRLKKDVTYHTAELTEQEQIRIPSQIELVFDLNGHKLSIYEDSAVSANPAKEYFLFRIEGSLNLIDSGKGINPAGSIVWKIQSNREKVTMFDITTRRDSSLSLNNEVSCEIYSVNGSKGRVISHGAGTVLLYDTNLKCTMENGDHAYGYYGVVKNIDMKVRAYELHTSSTAATKVMGFFVDESAMKADYDCYISGALMNYHYLGDTTGRVIEIYGGPQVMKDITNPHADGFAFDLNTQHSEDIEMSNPRNSKCFFAYGKYGFIDIVGADPGDVFSDVGDDELWYYRNVSFAYNRGLMTGMDKTHFAPRNTLNRAQFAVILYRMAGSPKVTYSKKFPDVPAGTFYSDAAIWANEQGIITGYTAGANAGKFGPANNITREQMATMMYRYAQASGYPTNRQDDISKFADAKKVSAFALDAMKWAYDSGIISGKANGTLAPQGTAVRAECAAIIERYLYNYDYLIR